MAVERCICHDVPFAEVVRRTRAGQGFAQISAETHCCTGCGMCEAYVHVAMLTGQHDLPVLSAGQVVAILQKARASGISAPSDARKMASQLPPTRN